MTASSSASGQANVVKEIPRQAAKTLLGLLTSIPLLFLLIDAIFGYHPAIDQFGWSDTAGLLLIAIGVITAAFTFLYEIYILTKYRSERGFYYQISLANLILSVLAIIIFITFG